MKGAIVTILWVFLVCAILNLKFALLGMLSIVLGILVIDELGWYNR